MQIPNLEAFNEVPFLFWAKDKSGTYRWGNQAINRFTGENVVGKTDGELIWCDDAESLQAADGKVFETGEPAISRNKLISRAKARQRLTSANGSEKLMVKSTASEYHSLSNHESILSRSFEPSSTTMITLLDTNFSCYSHHCYHLISRPETCVPKTPGGNLS